MKTKSILFIIAMTVFSIGSLYAKTETKTFKVYGNCGMCKKRIEKAATGVKGTTTADWDQKTKMMKVVFDSDSTNLETIEKAIAKVGHDTDKVKANDKTYAALPGCCKYERPAKK